MLQHGDTFAVESDEAADTRGVPERGDDRVLATPREAPEDDETLSEHRTAARLETVPVAEGPGRVRAMAAGAAAAAVWGLQEPIDQRLIGCDYSDVAVLGKALTHGRAWWPVGFMVHLANGALFGLAFREAHRRWPGRPRALAVGMALGEHVVLYPLCYFVDRFHPQRGAPGVPALLKNRRAFAQATWRHAVFGFVLGWSA